MTGIAILEQWWNLRRWRIGPRRHGDHRWWHAGPLAFYRAPPPPEEPLAGSHDHETLATGSITAAHLQAGAIQNVRWITADELAAHADELKRLTAERDQARDEHRFTLGLLDKASADLERLTEEMCRLQVEGYIRDKRTLS